jgi:hypothetical protein
LSMIAQNVTLSDESSMSLQPCAGLAATSTGTVVQISQ